MPFGTCVWATGVAMNPLVSPWCEALLPFALLASKQSRASRREHMHTQGGCGCGRHARQDMLPVARTHLPRCPASLPRLPLPLPAGAGPEGAAAAPAGRGPECAHRGGGGWIPAGEGHKWNNLCAGRRRSDPPGEPRHTGRHGQAQQHSGWPGQTTTSAETAAMLPGWPAPTHFPPRWPPVPCCLLPPTTVQDKALEDAASLFASADTDGDQRLTADEVCTLLKKVDGWAGVAGDAAGGGRSRAGSTGLCIRNRAWVPVPPQPPRLAHRLPTCLPASPACLPAGTEAVPSDG